MISLNKVSKHYLDGNRVNTALNEISFTAESGEFIIITGPSGSGKSTLLNMLSGTDNITSGEYIFDGRDTDGFDEQDWEDFRRDDISLIYQDYRIIEEYTVKENIELALALHMTGRKAIREKADELMHLVGIYDCAKKRSKYLSGGQKQRVAIARALANDPKVILADEPTANLDARNSGEIVKLLKSLSADRLVIVVTHNAELFESAATRRIELDDGKIVHDNITGGRVSKVAPSASEKTSTENKRRPIYGLLKHNRNGTAIFWVLLFVLLFAFCVYSLVLSGLSASGSEIYETPFFSCVEKNRYILTKTDGEPFLESDYTAIGKKYSDAKIIKEDIVLDCTAQIYNPSTANYITLNVRPISFLDSQITTGKMPENDYQVICGNEYGTPSLNFEDSSVYHSVEFGDIVSVNVQISGWTRIENSDRSTVYVSDNIYNLVYIHQYLNSSKISLSIDGQNADVSKLIPSEKMESGKLLIIGEDDIVSSGAQLIVQNIHGSSGIDSLTVVSSAEAQDIYNEYKAYDGAVIISYKDAQNALSDRYQISIFTESTVNSWDNYNVIYPYAINIGHVDSQYELQKIIYFTFLILISAAFSFVAYMFFRRRAKSEIAVFSVRRMLGEAKLHIYVLSYLRCLLPALLAGAAFYLVYLMVYRLGAYASGLGYFIPLSNIPAWQVVIISMILCFGITLPLAIYENKKPEAKKAGV